MVYPTYFAPIIQYVGYAQFEKCIFEQHDHFLKQTYRNRCYILGPNGKQLLSVPLIHSQDGTKLRTSEVKIDNSFSWQKQHLKSLQSAYRSSPFYEYYEPELEEIFSTRFDWLKDLQFKSFELVNECLGLEVEVGFSELYQDKIPEDYRALVIAKKEPNYHLSQYTQVFNDKHGFVPNLSILDLLFNEGPNTLCYLEAQPWPKIKA